MEGMPDSLLPSGSHDDTVFPTYPVLAVPVNRTGRERTVLVTRFLSWLSIVLFLTAVLIALIGAGAERNQLRSQIAIAANEMVCRASADDALLIAIAERDTTITEALIAVADGDDLGLARLTRELQVQNAVVAEEIENMQVALAQCAGD